MRRISQSLWSGVLVLSIPATAAPVVALHLDFDSQEASKKWELTNGKLVPRQDARGNALLVTNPDPARSVTCTFPVPVAKIAGRFVTIEAAVRAENVSRPPRSWNGVKVMLVLQTKYGTEYPQLPIPVGTFGWTEFQRGLRVAGDIEKATLVLGLEKVSGRAWFDDVRILVGRPERTGRRYKTKFTGHAVPRLRGVMYGPRCREEDLRVLAEEWHANQIRFQLNWVPMKKAETWAKDIDAYNKWLDEELKEADKAAAACEKYHLHMLLDLHCPPGGRVRGGVCRMFQEKKYQDLFISVWQRIARRYKGRKVIYAYDLLNEPVEGRVREGLLCWRDLAMKATEAIREIDPGKPVVFEPGPWGGPRGFDALTPLDLDRVIYSFHMYEPHQFTHQGVHGRPAGLVYPGVIGAHYWNKERLREAMQPVIDFQRAFNVQIYVGEFSAIRWAPQHSAWRYLRDVIDLFEEYGWDWSYHAFREWDGWSVEHGPDPNVHTPSPTPTERMKLLLHWFAKNQR